MGKIVLHEDEARKQLLAGAEILYNAVSSTMGPKGRNVVIAREYGPAVVTHDGVTVARSIDLTDTKETLGQKAGAELIKSAASKMNDVAGDGTTTVTVLTYHILKEATKLIAAGHNPMTLRRELESASKLVLEELAELSEDITDKSEKVAQIATISSGDAVIGELIAKIIKEIGKNGVVTVEESQGLELESEIVKGFTFDRGFVSPYMVNDTARMEAAMEKPLILVTDIKIQAIQQLVPLLEAIAQTGRKELLIIAEDIEGEALATLVLNKLKGNFFAICVKTPAFGDQRKDILDDIATLTGATVVSGEQGMQLETSGLDVLGEARSALVTKSETTIIEGLGAKEDVVKRIHQIHERQEHAKSEYEKEQYERRAASLEDKVAVIKVGGITETEIEEKKFRVDDAVHAVKAALADGIVPGGGITPLRLADKINVTQPGGKLLATALCLPFEVLMLNSGLNAMQYYDKLKKPELGVDAETGEIVDVKKVGIVDPTRVTKEAIQNAVSIAGTVMTMGALIVEEPQEKPQDPVPPGFDPSRFNQ